MKRITIISIVIILVTISCKTKDSIEVQTNIFQDLKAEFRVDDNKTIGWATFREKDEDGIRLELSGEASVLFNGEKHDKFSNLDNYFYSWNTHGLEDVEYTFTDNSGTSFTNKILLNDTINISIPINFIDIELDKTMQVKWVGKPLGENEEIQMYIKQGNLISGLSFLGEEGASIIEMEPSFFDNLSVGEAVLYIERTRTINNIEQADEAGGRKVLSVVRNKTINITAK